MTDQESKEKTLTQEDENKLIAQRREKLAALRELGTAYPNDFRRDSLAAGLHGLYKDKSTEDLESMQIRVSVAGRMMAKRVMGKASFTKLQDMSGYSCSCSAIICQKVFTTKVLKNGISAT